MIIFVVLFIVLFFSYLQEKREFIENGLQRALIINDSHITKIINSMNYSLLGEGKRIRPILCLTTAELFGGNLDGILPTAIALEMIHSMSLIHDSLPVMDRSNHSYKRNKPTNHLVYGEDIAILAGDALLSCAFEYIATYTPSNVIPAEWILKVISKIGQAVGPNGMAGAEVKELECDHREKDSSSVAYPPPTLEDLQWIHIHKTASLLCVSVLAGAILAGATTEEIDICEKFAEKIGLAFQSESVNFFQILGIFSFCSFLSYLCFHVLP
jgi:geranylgeranyl diphosphate synthase type II